jgi:uncharacterized protein
MSKRVEIWVGTAALLAVVLALPVRAPAAERAVAPAPGMTAESPLNTPVVDWRMLLGLNYRTGEVNPALQALNGKRVRVPGFMVPLEDGADGVDEFLLVPYFGACIHTPPPPPNQMVYVKMNRGSRVRVDIWNPVWVEGTLKIEDVDSPYGVVGFELTGLSVTAYR